MPVSLFEFAESREVDEPPHTRFGVDPIVTAKFRLERPNGRVYLLHRLTTHRRGGTRYQVLDVEGRLLFDTQDHYDFGNAVNAVERWLDSAEPETPW